jgi:hypothetical protein
LTVFSGFAFLQPLHSNRVCSILQALPFLPALLLSNSPRLTQRFFVRKRRPYSRLLPR